MCDNEKDLQAELNDGDLEHVTGGISEEIYLDEERLPLGWLVTCCNCRMVFPVSEGSCPVCGGVAVLPGAQGDVIYDSRYWKKSGN